MSERDRERRALAGWLLVVTAAAAWPLLASPDAALGYYDNALHLAELHALARTGPLADVACLGVDLFALHTPLYRLLAALVQAGVPAAPLYLAMLPLSLGALGLSALGAAARRTTPRAAFVLALLVVIAPAELRGTGSPLAGMWPFALSSALVLRFVDRLGEPAPTPRRAWLGHHVALGLWAGGALLAHAFAAYAVAVLLVAASVLALRRRNLARLAGLAGTALVATTLALPYLGPLWLEARAGEPAFFNPPLLPMALSLIASLPPTGETVGAFALGIVPAVVLFALSARGAEQLRRDAPGDDAPLLVAITTAVLFVLVLAVAGTEATFLGPLSPRLGQLARAGWPILAARVMASPRIERAPLPLLGVAGTLVAALCALPLAAELDPETMREARALARHVRALAPEGRVLVGASYDDPALPPALARSQAAISGLLEDGVGVVGAYYSSLPPRTRTWTSALPAREIDGEPRPAELMGVPITSAASVDALLPGLDAAAVSHVIVHDPQVVAALAAHPSFRRAGGAGRFVTFHRAPSDTGARRTGRATFEVDAAGTVTLPFAYHPTLSVRDHPEAALGHAEDGRLTVSGLGAGPIELTRSEPRGPWIAALVVALAALALGRWSSSGRAMLRPMRAGGPFTFTVRGRQRP